MNVKKMDRLGILLALLVMVTIIGYMTSEWVRMAIAGGLLLCCMLPFLPPGLMSCAVIAAAVGIPVRILTKEDGDSIILFAGVSTLVILMVTAVLQPEWFCFLLTWGMDDSAWGPDWSTGEIVG